MSKRAKELAKQLYPDPKLEDYDDILVYRAHRDSALWGRINTVRVYKQAEKDLGWISVKDRLPEENKWVFVCVDMQGVPQCVGLGYLKDGEWCDDENDNGFCVDYWMEIPKFK